jgi:hypothetical protein
MTNQEEYELKKQERLEKRKDFSKNAKSKEASKKSFKWLIWLIILALLAWWVVSSIRKNLPEGEDFSQALSSMGREHIALGTGSTTPEGKYNSNPPSSGPHYPNTAKTGFYDEPLEDQFIIHNLEHGDIWIAYHPRISDLARSELAKLAERYVIISPREANDFDISLVSWGRIDSFNLKSDSLPIQRIRDFILRYDDQGPEKVRSGSMR